MKDRKDIRSKVGSEAREPEWKERLRAGDPAQEAAPLDPQEVAALRRAALAAAEEDEAVLRRAIFAPYRLGAAMAAVGGLVWLIWFGIDAWRGGPEIPVQVIEQQSASAPVPSPSAPRPPRAPILAEERLHPAPPSAPEPVPSPRAPRSSSPHGSGPRRHPHSAPVPDREAVPRLASNRAPAEAAPATPAQDRRELQFSTPGGTRIVWVFASGEAPSSTPPLPSRL